MDALSYGFGIEHHLRAHVGRADTMSSSACPPPIAAKPTRAPAPASLDALPDELKLHILQHTGPNPFVLARMQLVSRNWRRLAQDDSLWEPLYPRAFVQAPMALPAARIALTTPQRRFAAHIQGSNHLRKLFFRELWAGRNRPATVMAGSHDAIFACHAFLALGSRWDAKRLWHLQSRARENALLQDSIWIQLVVAGAMG